MINEFTHQEMLDFLKRSDKQLFPLIKKASSISEESILKYKLRYTKSTAERVQYIQECFQQVSHKEDEPKILLDALHGVENRLLNDLEWFSMQCRYGVADEKLLYQSLHQTFLAEVQLLYLRISIINTESEDKYYTNIIWLFTKWRKRLIKYREKNQRARERANREIEKVKAKAKRAGNSLHRGRAI